MKRGRSSFIDDDDIDALYFSLDNNGCFCGYVDDCADDRIVGLWGGFLLYWKEEMDGLWFEILLGFTEEIRFY